MRAGRAPSGVFGILIFGSVGLLTIFTLAPADPPGTRVSQIASIPLTDDDGGQALFAATELGPGRPVTRCLEISYAGTTAPGDVHLLAEGVSGALAGRLDVRVERGTGGGFASCTGFAGSQVFHGPLTDLTDGAAGVDGISTGWVPAATDRRTYRITVDVSGGAAPGQTSAATFRWLIVPQPAPPPPPPPPPAPPVPAPVAPTVPPVTDPPASPTATTPAPIATVPPTTEAPADPTPAAASPDGAARPDRPSGGKLGPLVERAVKILYEVTSRTARHSSLPIASIAALALFVVIQNRIDKRDPKLALAPMTGDPYLYFDGDEPAPGLSGGAR
jgi:hypothetical protein